MEMLLGKVLREAPMGPCPLSPKGHLILAIV